MFPVTKALSCSIYLAPPFSLVIAFYLPAREDTVYEPSSNGSYFFMVLISTFFKISVQSPALTIVMLVLQNFFCSSESEAYVERDLTIYFKYIIAVKEDAKVLLVATIAWGLRKCSRAIVLLLIFLIATKPGFIHAVYGMPKS